MEILPRSGTFLMILGRNFNIYKYVNLVNLKNVQYYLTECLYSISAVSPQEAVWFNLDWKVPCVLQYTAKSFTESAPFVSPLCKWTFDVFGEDKCIARSGGTRGITFTPLSADETPKKGKYIFTSCTTYINIKKLEVKLKLIY